VSSVDRLVLDTSAYSHFRAGHPGVLDRMADAAVLVVPAVVLGELGLHSRWVGALKRIDRSSRTSSTSRS